MTVGPEHDAPRPAHGNDFSDAVTVAFGDAGADLYGVARLGLAEGGASGLAILFARGEPVGVSAEGGVEVSAPASWDEVSAAGLDTTTIEPLARGAFSTPATTPPSTSSSRPWAPSRSSTRATPWRARRDGGLRAAGARAQRHRRRHRVEIDGLGQRGHSWGSPDWDRIELARTISALARAPTPASA